MQSLRASLLTLLFVTSSIAQTNFTPLTLRGQTSIHDPSTIVREDARHFVFGTGVGLRVRSSTNLTDWVEERRVFDGPLAWMTNAVPGFRGHFWAPDVIRINNRWLLYYSISTFGKQLSAIGLATNPTLNSSSTNYAWTDHGAVIQSKPGDPFNTIDPNLMLDRDGKLWMAYGSYWRGIYLIELDPKTGMRRDTNSVPQRLAWNESIEAVCLTRHGDDYVLFVNWGQCCRGTNSTYEVRVGRSKSIGGPYLDRNGKSLVDGGGTEFLQTSGRFVGPGHIGVLNENGTNWFSYHFYDGDNFGRSRLANGRLEWDSEGWPRAKSP